MDIEIGYLKTAYRLLLKDYLVTLAIIAPPVVLSVASGMLIDFTLGDWFPFWGLMFTVFFFARMSFAWHRWQLLGETPALWGTKGRARDRWRYVWRVGFLFVVALFGFALTMAEMLSALTGGAGITWANWQAKFCLAFGGTALLLFSGHALPGRAVGLPNHHIPRLDARCILVGTLGFGTVWFLGLMIMDAILHSIPDLPDYAGDLAIQLINAPISVCIASFLVAAAPNTWARGQIAAGTLRSMPPIREDHCPAPDLFGPDHRPTSL